MFFKNKLTLALFVLGFFVMANSGCDRHKAERAELSKQITVIEADLVPLQEQQARASQEVEQLNSEVKQQSDALQPHLDQVAKLQDELALYVQDHQTTALVLKMTRTGVATVLESQANQKTKDLIRTGDVIGRMVAVAYCLRKGEECRNATLKIMSFGSQIDAENAKISMMTAQLDQAKASLQEREQKRSSIDAALAAKTKERDTLKQRLDAIS